MCEDVCVCLAEINREKEREREDGRYGFGQLMIHICTAFQVVVLGSRGD